MTRRTKARAIPLAADPARAGKLAAAGLMLATALILAIALAWARPAAAQSPSISPEASAALSAALSDEYHAEAFYAAVIDKFGAVRPFANIIGAEQQHAQLVRQLMLKYGIEPPQNALLGSAAIADQVPATLAEACRIGVEAEIANRDLYDGKLLPASTAYPDITQVFNQLKWASETRHLPAFQRCGGRA